MTNGKPGVRPRATEINLDFTPMTEPVSIFVLLGEDNQARVVRYGRYQLNVAAIYQGNLPGAQVAQLLGRIGEPALMEAFRRRNFGGNGLTSGDQFHLSFKSKEGVAGECFGFVDEAPAVVRSLIEELLALQKQSEEAALSDAYLRSEPIAGERFQALQRSGKLRFASLNEFSPDIQPILASAVARPRDFLSLTQTQYERLLPQASHGHEFFMTINGSGYQFTLFKARQ
ncbi:MAG TPA: hypothetical protein VGX92_03320 [Pyrinomonadaceae bacterium]|jgi:hypothetical protein|nr:hypothetical protein [Pyrinomonadaceae bacterium]